MWRFYLSLLMHPNTHEHHVSLTIRTLLHYEAHAFVFREQINDAVQIISEVVSFSLDFDPLRTLAIVSVLCSRLNWNDACHAARPVSLLLFVCSI